VDKYVTGVFVVYFNHVTGYLVHDSVNEACLVHEEL
jgi:hypothetical protein